MGDDDNGVVKANQEFFQPCDGVQILMLGNARLYEIMKEKEAIYAKEDFTDEDGIKASELEAEFAAMNGWEAESDAAALLNGLGIGTESHYEMMKSLNGPEKVKVLLAQALFGNPDIREMNSCSSFIFSSFFLFASFIWRMRSWLDSYQKS